MLLIAACWQTVAVAQNDATIPNRVAWTNSRIVGSPDPLPRLKQVRRFPNLKFKQPLYIERGPDNERLWIVTREGQVWSFPDRQDVTEANLFADFRKDFSQLTQHATATKVDYAYGLAFHPNYPQVPVCWLTYTLLSDDRQNHLEDGTRLSRFHVVFDEQGIPRCDVSSEKVLISWPEGGHNGACLKFGPDGYLYVSAGDGEVPNPPDPRRAGQDVTNVLSTVLRIDVNPTNEGQLYTVPKDNPFAKAATHKADAITTGDNPVSELNSTLQFRADEALPEIWAYGFRNPWKMTFGPDGQLWVGDVGWELYEMVYNVKPGGNYGWSIVEGPHTVVPDGKHGPTPILPAAIAYSHSEGASVTGGYVYQGNAFPELKGKYVFGDFETRRIWSADIAPQPDGGSDRLTNLTDLVDPSVRIVAFGEDTSKELLLLHFDEGTIYGLERNEVADERSTFPEMLSQTGLFADTQQQVPSAGVTAFEINEPMWNDGATATRFLAVPSEKAIDVLPGPRRIANSSVHETMQFPENSVLVRTVTLQDDSQKQIELETQLLHFTGKVWNAYTYVWNPEQTDAALAPATGTELDLSKYGLFSDRTVWNIHSRSECLRCHNAWIGGPLAFTLPQLNCDAPHSGNSAATNQVKQFRNAGLLTGSIPEDPETTDEVRVAKLANSRDASANIEQRARAYLAVNCAHCHQNGAGGTATIDLRHEASLDETKTTGATPVQGAFQITGGAIIKPGEPSRSVLLYRAACSGRGRMPHIGSRHVDIEGIAMLREWIASLKTADSSAPPAPSLETTSAAMELVVQLDQNAIESAERNRLLKAAQSAAPEIRNLFTRFQPLEYQQQQHRTLNISNLLSLQGNANRGAELFAGTGIQCINCHRIGNTGGQIGPAMDDVGRRLKRDEILESILNPSKKIDPKFAAWTALTTAGKAYSGLLVSRSEKEVTLRTAKNENIVIATADLEELVQQTTSLMPDRLLNDLTDQQISDLLQFLATQNSSK